MWKHLERQAGGIGTRGPGETQLETDRRLVRERDRAAQAPSSQAVERERETQRRRRAARVPRRARRLHERRQEHAVQRAHPRRRVRRGPAVRHARLHHAPAGEPGRAQVVLLTDTVGFIRKLPHHLVASFHSTLVEAIEADLLLHVVDAADPDFRRRCATSRRCWRRSAARRPRARAPTLLVFNKIDAVTDEALPYALPIEFPGSVQVSARDGRGIPALRARLWHERSSQRAAAALKAAERRAARGGISAGTPPAPSPLSRRRDLDEVDACGLQVAVLVAAVPHRGVRARREVGLHRRAHEPPREVEDPHRRRPGGLRPRAPAGGRTRPSSAP